MHNRNAEAPIINVCVYAYRERSNEADYVAQPMCLLGGCTNKVAFTVV